MRAAELVEGASYALRQWTPDGETLVEVSYVGPARGDEVRVRHRTGGEDGLDAWVPVERIACAWSERGALARDEQRAARLAQADDDTWDPVTDGAIAVVMNASGEYSGFTRRWTSDPDRAQRFWRRGRLPGSPLDHHPNSYTDRDGTWHLSFATALTAAQAFAAAEPDLVDLYLRSAEDRVRADGAGAGDRDLAPDDGLRALAPVHALVRDWSREPARGDADQEVDRLRGLVQQAVELLHSAGDEHGARRLDQALDGGGRGDAATPLSAE